MDRYCRNLLKFIKNFDSGNPNYVLINSLYDAYNVYSGIPEPETVACVRHLEKQGFIKFAHENGVAVAVILEHKAYHPYALGLERFKEFLFCSMFTPIVISFVTTILTLLATKIFQ